MIVLGSPWGPATHKVVLAQLAVPGVSFILCGVSVHLIKKKKKKIDYFYNISGAVVPGGISCQDSHYCSSLDSQLGKTVAYFLPMLLKASQ